MSKKISVICIIRNDRDYFSLIKENFYNFDYPQDDLELLVLDDGPENMMDDFLDWDRTLYIHMSQEDISVARSIPNMQVISLCDPFEIQYCLNFLTKYSKHPTYLRIGKSGEIDLTTNSLEPWKFGKIRKISKGKKICFIGHGPILKKLININIELKKFNLCASIYEAHTLKPFDYKRIKNIFKNYTHIFSIEDHSVIGGLQSLLKESAYELKFKGVYQGFSLKDQFIKSYGSQDDLLKMHGLSEDNIYKSIKKKLKIK